MTNPVILHIGFGQFHRAHQAVYVNELNKKLPLQNKIKIFPMSLREQNPISFTQLKEQNYKYTVTSFKDNIRNTQFIEVHDCPILGLKEFKKLPLAQKKNIKWITITATEKSYTNLPQSMVHSLCHILEDFFENALTPPIVISCDNIMLNGDYLRNLISEINNREEIFSEQELLQLRFANSLVDRIVPAHKPEWTEVIKKEQSFSDDLCVFTEDYSVWIIENKTTNTHLISNLTMTDTLGLENVGVRFVDDIKPYNQQKLFLLNGAHSLLAYLGLKKDLTTVEQAIKDQEILNEVKKFWASEAQPFLSLNLGHKNYCENLISRFQNPFVGHQLLQIAQDGFQKIRQRWLPLLVHWNNKTNALPPVIKIGLCAYWQFAHKHLDINDKQTFVSSFEVDKAVEELIHIAISDC